MINAKSPQWKTAADGPVEKELHKAFGTLQQSITQINKITIDHVSHVPSEVMHKLSTLMKDMDMIAQRLEDVEGDVRAFEYKGK